METSQILIEIDAEIERLQQVKLLLSGSAAIGTSHAAPTPKKRTMSAKGRAHIAAAQKARWAKVKKAAK